MKKFVFHFWVDRKIIFWISWKFFRTSRSMQNLLADRMEALSASESHSQTFPQKRLFFFPLGTEIDLIWGPNFLGLLYSSE